MKIEVTGLPEGQKVKKISIDVTFEEDEVKVEKKITRPSLWEYDMDIVTNGKKIDTSKTTGINSTPFRGVDDIMDIRYSAHAVDAVCEDNRRP